MPDRTNKRPAGATRITNPRLKAADETLPTADLSGFTRPQLERVAVDRGLATTGTDAELRARILADMTGA